LTLAHASAQMRVDVSRKRIYTYHGKKAKGGKEEDREEGHKEKGHKEEGNKKEAPIVFFSDKKCPSLSRGVFRFWFGDRMLLPYGICRSSSVCSGMRMRAR